MEQSVLQQDYSKESELFNLFSKIEIILFFITLSVSVIFLIIYILFYK
jgi:hypothetical protein